MADLDFDLLPADDEGLAPADDLAAAAASAFASADEGVPEADLPVPMPFGKTPLFDFERGRMVRQGGSPVYVRGRRALEQRCLMAIHSARFAHAVFSDAFGMERPEAPRGDAVSVEAAAEFGRRLRDALLPFDRVVAVENIEVDFPEDGVMFIRNFDVVTDEEERIPFSDIRIERA